MDLYGIRQAATVCHIIVQSFPFVNISGVSRFRKSLILDGLSWHRTSRYANTGLSV